MALALNPDVVRVLAISSRFPSRWAPIIAQSNRLGALINLRSAPTTWAKREGIENGHDLPLTAWSAAGNVAPPRECHEWSV
jgi:hypothetical protein